MSTFKKKLAEKQILQLKEAGKLVYLPSLDLFVRTKRSKTELEKVLAEVDKIIREVSQRLQKTGKELRNKSVNSVLNVLSSEYRDKLLKSLAYRKEHGIQIRTFGQLIGLIVAGVYKADDFDKCLLCDKKASALNSTCNLACTPSKGTTERHDQRINLLCNYIFETASAKRAKELAKRNADRINSSPELRQKRFEGFVRRTQSRKDSYEELVQRRLSVFLDHGVFNSKYIKNSVHKRRVQALLQEFAPEQLVKWEKILLENYVPEHIEILYPEYLHRLESYAIARCKKHGLYSRSQCRFGLEELFKLRQAERASPHTLKTLQVKYFGCPFCRLERAGERKSLVQEFLVTEILREIPDDILQSFIIYTEYRRNKATWDLGFVPLKSFQNLVDQFKIDPSIKSIDTSTLLAKLVVDIDTEYYHRTFINYENFLKTVRAAYEVKFKPNWPFPIVQYIVDYDPFEEVVSIVTSILTDEVLTPAQFSEHNFIIFSEQRGIASIEPVCYRHGQRALVLKPLVQLTEEGLTNLVNFVRSKEDDNVAIYLDTRFTQKFGKEVGWLEFDNDLLKTWYNFEKLSLQEAYDRHLHLGFIPVKVG